MTLRLRPFVATDLPALAELWVASWRATLPEINFAARRDWLIARLTAHHAAGTAIVCAADDDDVLGFITVDPALGHIDQLAVCPQRFGTGVASALLAEARRRSPGGLALEVNQQNPRAVAFYWREGFEIVGEGSIGTPGRPIWLMRWQPTTD